MFHSLPDVLKIYQIQFDRSLVNIAFSADSLPFEPINFQFQLSSLEGNHLYLLLNCAHKTKHFLTTIDNFWRETEVDLSWIKGLCQLSIKSRTRKMSRKLCRVFYFPQSIKSSQIWKKKFYFWVRKIAREESISPHASRHKPPKVVSVRVLNLQIVIWCNKLCIPQHHVLDTTQIICLVFLFSTKVYTRVHQSRALYPMCAMRKSNSKPSKHHHIENSFESHNELRHGISGKFVINDTSRLRLGVRPRDSRVTFLIDSYFKEIKWQRYTRFLVNMSQFKNVCWKRKIWPNSRNEMRMRLKNSTWTKIARGKLTPIYAYALVTFVYVDKSFFKVPQSCKC